MADIEVNVNVAYAMVCTTTNDNSISQDKSATMTVDNITHHVAIPDNWGTGQYDTVSMGKIKIVALTINVKTYQNLLLWVNLIECYCKLSKLFT